MKTKEVNGENYLSVRACQELSGLSAYGWYKKCRKLKLKQFKFEQDSRSVYIRESDFPAMGKPTPVEK